MSSTRPEQEFTLDDGRTFTPSEVGKILKISNSAARARLKQSSNPDMVFRKPNTYITTPTAKKFKCSDGKVRTARQAALEFNMPLSIISPRMRRAVRAGKEVIDIDDITKKVQRGPQVGKTQDAYVKQVNEVIAERMYFDPDGHWKLLAKNT